MEKNICMGNMLVSETVCVFFCIFLDGYQARVNLLFRACARMSDLFMLYSPCCVSANNGGVAKVVTDKFPPSHSRSIPSFYYIFFAVVLVILCFCKVNHSFLRIAKVDLTPLCLLQALPVSSNL